MDFKITENFFKKTFLPTLIYYLSVNKFKAFTKLAAPDSLSKFT